MAARKTKAPPAVSPEQLTDEEILAELARAKAERDRAIAEARANLAKFGSVLPPVVPATVERVIPSRSTRTVDPKWFATWKVCPHCGEKKNVGRDFGVIVRRGVESASGWCRACRSRENYRSKERKNRSKHNQG